MTVLGHVQPSSGIFSAVVYFHSVFSSFLYACFLGFCLLHTLLELHLIFSPHVCRCVCVCACVCACMSMSFLFITVLTILWILPVHRSTDSILCILPVHRSTDSIVCILPVHHSTDSILCILPVHHSTDSILCILPVHRSTDSILSILPVHRSTDSILSILEKSMCSCHGPGYKWPRVEWNKKQQQNQYSPDLAELKSFILEVCTKPFFFPFLFFLFFRNVHPSPFSFKFMQENTMGHVHNVKHTNEGCKRTPNTHLSSPIYGETLKCFVFGVGGNVGGFRLKMIVTVTN